MDLVGERASLDSSKSIQLLKKTSYWYLPHLILFNKRVHLFSVTLYHNEKL